MLCKHTMVALEEKLRALETYLDTDLRSTESLLLAIYMSVCKTGNLSATERLNAIDRSCNNKNYISEDVIPNKLLNLLNDREYVKQYNINKNAILNGPIGSHKLAKNCTLLTFYAFVNRADVIKKLLQLGANPDQKDLCGRTALDVAKKI